MSDPPRWSAKDTEFLVELRQELASELGAALQTSDVVGDAKLVSSLVFLHHITKNPKNHFHF
jgi:hypothetical protein